MIRKLLRQAESDYLQHKPWCDIVVSYDSKSICTCGLENWLQELWERVERKEQSRLELLDALRTYFSHEETGDKSKAYQIILLHLIGHPEGQK